MEICTVLLFWMINSSLWCKTLIFVWYRSLFVLFGLRTVNRVSIVGYNFRNYWVAIRSFQSIMRKKLAGIMKSASEAKRFNRKRCMLRIRNTKIQNLFHMSNHFFLFFIHVHCTTVSSIPKCKSNDGPCIGQIFTNIIQDADRAYIVEV